jgi:hypothetical protein
MRRTCPGARCSSIAGPLGDAVGRDVGHAHHALEQLLFQRHGDQRPDPRSGQPQRPGLDVDQTGDVSGGTSAGIRRSWMTR